MNQDKIKSKHVERTAVVYVRQSTKEQLVSNQESTKRQYGLVPLAKELGFTNVVVIDEDLGKSAASTVERSGFSRLVSSVSMNEVGMVLGIEVSRFARSNRDWYHLLDLCALFDTLIADFEGIYNPSDPNDRLVLGLKGTMSEVELNVLRNRMQEGLKQKAKRGELITCMSVGYIAIDDLIQKRPDRRVQEAIRLIFDKFRELGTVRQVHIWFRSQNIAVPILDHRNKHVVWRLPVYSTLLKILQNPIYAGAYAYGRYETRVNFQDGKISKSAGHKVEQKDWDVLLKDHHEGYITWQEFEDNQRMITGNLKGIYGSSSGAPGKGHALLAGILRCRKCGRKLRVSYSGAKGRVVRYLCNTALLKDGDPLCINFGGLRVDKAVSEQVIEATQPLSIDAAMKAFSAFESRSKAKRDMLVLELREAEYKAERAFRQFDNSDPENRLVTSELEKKWEEGLESVDRIKNQLTEADRDRRELTSQDQARLSTIAENLQSCWYSNATTNAQRKRIIRTVIREIVVDIDQTNSIIRLVIHWVGGKHTELEVKKNKPGQHSRTTNKSIVELVSQLASQMPDKSIAATLNKLKLKTGVGNSWNAGRVKVLRHYNKIPAFSIDQTKQSLTMDEAASHLKVSTGAIRKMIASRLINAAQVVPHAPWAIPRSEIEKEEVLEAANRFRSGQKLDPAFAGQQELFQ